MKRLVSVLLLSLLLPLLLLSQVQLTFTGSASDGSIISGEMLSWQITNVPVGGTTNNELWVDVDMNGSLDTGTDKLLFRFNQIDGGAEYDGPGDGDGMANGTITTSFPAGLAPAHWIFVVGHPSGNAIGAFEITHMLSPAATISGTVSVPTGYSKANIVIEANTESGSGSGMDPFWHALTDANGNYTIELGSVTGDPATMNPWRVGLSQGGVTFGRLVPTKRDTSVNVGGTPPVVNFTFIEGTILTGRLLDQNNQPVVNSDAHTHDAANENEGEFYGQMGPDGYFELAVPPGNYKLHFGARGYFDSWYNNAQDFSSATQITVTTQDTIKNLNGTVQQAGVIAGHVRNYGMPVQASIKIFTTDSTQVWDGGTWDQGRYDATLNPGSYIVMFDYMGNIQYYDHTTSWPGDLITITGTEQFTNIDADFTVGTPPIPDPPELLRVWDVPFDNGRHVYVKWTGIDRMYALTSGGDGPAFGIESYSIWRQDGAEWVFMRSVPAAMDSTYTTIVQTLKDSTKTEGMFMSTYMVKAHFIFNSYVMASAPMMGYSLDNMAPGVPAGLGSVVSGSDVVLRWTPNEDEDFKYYTVYRSTSPDFSVQGLTPYGVTATTEYVDAGAAGGSFYYRLTATDHAGNQSDASVIVTSSGTTAAEHIDVLPTSFELYRNYPNPFNPTTTIAFDLPLEAHVQITVYNALGEKMGTIVDGVRSAGTHTAAFDATALPSGLYFYRMQAGAFSAVKKMSLIR